MTRYGIGELYGKDFSRLTANQMRTLSSFDFGEMDCPFHIDKGKYRKKGGVCSLLLYERLDKGEVRPVGGASLVSTCPNRLFDSGVILKWIGEEVLATGEPIALKELPFLMSRNISGTKTPASVGKIDMVLVHPDVGDLKWCAVETQAVYFSGGSMEAEFKELRAWRKPGLPFPKKIRRPDFRSSGPKRLMPQLQIKVPTISRWGKKMAVVVDLPFWESMGKMDEEADASNSDVLWFVVRYEHNGARHCLKRDSVHFTTLARAVEGLTAGIPTTKEAFEERLLAKINK